MIRYTLRRLFSLVPVVFGVTLLVFLLLKLTPGDPLVALLGEDAQGMGAAELARLRDAYGLNDPWYLQYGRFLSDFITGQLASVRTGTPVLTEILARFPHTLLLTTVAPRWRSWWPCRSAFLRLSNGAPPGTLWSW